MDSQTRTRRFILRGMKPDPLRLLGECPYFKGLSPRHLAALADVCRVQTAAKRETLFFEGQQGQAVYLLISGNMQLVKTSEKGQEIVIRTIRPGEVFGEVILFERPDYPVTAVAISDSDVCRIPKAGFLELLTEITFRNDFIASLMGRMRYLAERLLDLTAYDVEERFFRFLEEQYGGRTEYRLTMSKKALAAAIGTTPETLSRLKERLTSQGRLVWEGRTIRLL